MANRFWDRNGFAGSTVRIETARPAAAAGLGGERMGGVDCGDGYCRSIPVDFLGCHAALLWLEDRQTATPDGLFSGGSGHIVVRISTVVSLYSYGNSALPELRDECLLLVPHRNFVPSSSSGPGSSDRSHASRCTGCQRVSRF